MFGKQIVKKHSNPLK